MRQVHGLFNQNIIDLEVYLNFDILVDGWAKIVEGYQQVPEQEEDISNSLNLLNENTINTFAGR